MANKSDEVSRKTWEEKILFTANVCDGGCKRLQERLQTFEGKEAVHCILHASTCV